MYITYRFIVKSIIAFGLLFITATVALAQNDDAINTFTPYSFYGIGDLTRPGTPYNRAMGGIGTGVRTNRQVNFLNPAALTAHDSLSFMMDFGFENQNYYSAYYAADPNDKDLHTTASNSFNVHHIVMSFPVARKLVVGMGLFPYSNVGYKMQRTEMRPEIIAETGNIYYTYQGEGNINQVTLSLGYAVNNQLSVGVQGQYYFGAIDRYSNILFTTDPYFSNVVSGTSLKVGNFGASLGAQYDYPLNKDLQLTVGATYQFSTPLGSRYLDFAYAHTGTLVDTIRHISKTESSISVPQMISIGFSIRKGDLWMVGADYVYQHWNNNILNNASKKHRFSVTPSHLFRAGLEWTPRRNDFRNYFNRCTYRAGFNYEKSYMSFDNRQISDIGASIGVYLPVNRWNTGVNLAAEIGQRGTTQHGLIRETYLKLSVSFSLFDFWFFRQKID